LLFQFIPIVYFSSGLFLLIDGNVWLAAVHWVYGLAVGGMDNKPLLVAVFYFIRIEMARHLLPFFSHFRVLVSYILYKTRLQRAIEKESRIFLFRE
jgi:hypothetical protein